MSEVYFESLVKQQFDKWEITDKKRHRKIAELIAIARENPFREFGKPEPLKYELAGCWSRRNTKADRLVYQVTDKCIIIISFHYHY